MCTRINNITLLAQWCAERFNGRLRVVILPPPPATQIKARLVRESFTLVLGPSGVSQKSRAEIVYTGIEALRYKDNF